MFKDTLIAFFKDKKYWDLLLNSTLIIVGGAIVYHYVEGWDMIDSLYFSVITLTTIGYGDFAPQTSTGKIFTIFYLDWIRNDSKLYSDSISPLQSYETRK